MDPCTLTRAVPALLLTLPAPADKIHTVDGRTISDVTIVTEHLGGVTYKDDKRKDGSISPDQVLEIEFESKPQLVDRADAAIAEEAYPDAQTDLLNFLEGMDEPPRKYPWSRAYALFRLIEVNEVLGELGGVVQTADRLVSTEPDSRYLPMALYKKAQALFDSGRGDDAAKALKALENAIQTKSLGDRWVLEHELAVVLLGDPRDSGRQAKLESLESRTRAYPQVHNRAQAALGETLFSAGKYGEAERVFRAIVKDPKGDTRTLAAAFTGLGDCLFRAGEPKAGTDEGKALLAEAQLSYMRVVVSYKGETRYLPKAMFYAGRCFQHLDVDEAGQEKANKLYNKLLRTFPDSPFANEAKGFRTKGTKGK